MASPPPSSSSSPPPPATTTTTTSQVLALPPPTPIPISQFQSSPTNSPSSSSPKAPPSSSSSSLKKPPPLPWTHQETVNLIQSYQDKWYSLKRGQLKASQWEEVSISVAARCGFDHPTKTSTQCRHKMEKLRKRYRAERLKPYPNSWQYFQLMDNMERGPFPLLAVAHPVNPHPPLHLPNPTNDSDSDDYHLSQKNKSKSINNILRGGVGVVYTANNQNVNGTSAGAGAGSSIYGRNSKRVPQLVGGNERGMMAKVARESLMNNNRKRMGYYEDSDDGDDDEEDEEVDVDGEGGDDGGAGDGGKELAAEIRGFAERFMRVERMKIEMMRETERHRMEMEKRRMEMIIDSQRKIVESIGRAFRAHKRLNTGQEL